jgi:hypothetical protein
MAAHRVMSRTVERASHVQKCPRCNEAPPQSCGYGSSSMVSSTSRSGERSTIAMLMDQIPRYLRPWYAIYLHDRVAHVLDEFMLEAGAIKGRDVRLEVRRIRSGASRGRPGDVV